MGRVEIFVGSALGRIPFPLVDTQVAELREQEAKEVEAKKKLGQALNVFRKTFFFNDSDGYKEQSLQLFYPHEKLDKDTELPKPLLGHLHYALGNQQGTDGEYWKYNAAGMDNGENFSFVIHGDDIYFSQGNI